MNTKRTLAKIVGISIVGVISPLTLAGDPPSAFIAAVDPAAAAVPTMSSSLMIGLGLLLAIIALRALKQYGGTAKLLCLITFGGGLAVGGIGVERSLATQSSTSFLGNVCEGGSATVDDVRENGEPSTIFNDCDSTTFEIISYHLHCPPGVQIKANGDVGTTHAPGSTAILNTCPGLGPIIE
jgi:hypothetical protein